MEHRRFYEAGSLTDTTSIDLIWRTHRAGRFDWGFRASRILCFDLDSSRTGAFGNEEDVV